MIQGKGFSFYHESRGQDRFQWVRYGFFHRKPVNERSKWSDAVRVRIPTTYSEIEFSNIRGHEMSLVRPNQGVLVSEMTGEAQGTVWNQF